MTVAHAAGMGRYLVRTPNMAFRLRDEDDRRRHGERIDALLRASDLSVRWIECKTSWLWPGVLDVIEASDERAAQAAADVIALANASVEQAA